MKLILMGTNEVVVPVFESLSKQHDIIAVFTRAPKPMGRKHVLTPSPVHVWAESRRFPVYTSIKEFDDSVAVLFYYSNVRGGSPSNLYVKYDESNNNEFGPVTAKNDLPTTQQWSNVSLKKTNRQIITETNLNNTNNDNLPIFDYSGYSARLLTYQELRKSCNNLFNDCIYLFENTEFSKYLPNSLGYWLENPKYQFVSDTIIIVFSMSGNVSFGDPNSTSSGLRPVIEVSKSRIKY